MSAIAARKARMAQQAESQGSSSSEQSSLSISAQTISSPKRKANVGDQMRPPKVSRQKLRSRQPNGKQIAAVVRASENGRNGQFTNTTDFEPAGTLNVAGEDDDSSDQSGEEFTEVEEDRQAEGAVRTSAFYSLKPVCSTYAPILEGKRKNWHINRLKTQGRGDAEIESSDSLIVGLAPSQTLFFVGKARVKVLEGTCSILSAHITSQHRHVFVYASQNAPLPFAQAPSGSPICRAFPEFGMSGGIYSAVLEIKVLTGTGIDDIAMACPLIRSGCFALPSASHLPTLEGFYPVLQPVRGLIASFVPSSWEQGLSSIDKSMEPTSFLVKGPKRVGKSTFSRHLLNRLVSTRNTSIAYLETDLGQTEFGPPGMVALHLFDSLSINVESTSDLVIGPSWTSLRYPLRSHFLGDTTPRDDPVSYKLAIADLFQYYNETLKGKGIPLIVNTQGWVKGLGADLLLGLERLLKPTHIFDMMQNDDDELISLEGVSGQRPGALLTRLEAAPLSLTRDRGLNSVEARTVNLISYFYSTRLPGPQLNPGSLNHGYPRWDFSQSLVQQRPYVIDVQEGLRAGLHILSKGARVEKPLELMALNGSCVAIVSSTSHYSTTSTASSSSDAIGVWYESLNQELPPLHSSHCIALAIVRSIDIDKGQVHLITPMSLQMPTSSHISTSHLCLVKGAIEVPIWLSLTYPIIEATQLNHFDQSISHLEGVPLSDVPFLDFAAASDPTSKSQSIGQEKRRVRRNILRRSQRPPP